MSRPAAPIDVFISYKREERDTAMALAEVLAARGYTVWWDVELLPGDRFADSIMEVIKHARATVVLWSEQSVASNFVRAEASLADRLDRLVPARLDRCELPLPFNTLHTLDLEPWRRTRDAAHLEPLFKAIEARIGQSPTAPQPSEAASGNLHGQDHETLLWRAITDKAAPSAKEYELYLAKHPDGIFADLARLRLGDSADGREEPPAPEPKSRDPGPAQKLASVFKRIFPGWLVRPLAGAACLAVVGSLLQPPLPLGVVSIAFALVLLLGAVLGAYQALLASVFYFGLVGLDLPVLPGGLSLSRIGILQLLLFANFFAGGIVVGYLADRGWCRSIRSSLAAFGIGALIALLLPAALILGDTPNQAGELLVEVVLPSAALIIGVAAATGWITSRKAA